MLSILAPLPERKPSLDASIERGLADPQAGRTKPASEVSDWLETKYCGMANVAIPRVGRQAIKGNPLTAEEISMFEMF